MKPIQPQRATFQGSLKLPGESIIVQLLKKLHDQKTRNNELVVSSVVNWALGSVVVAKGIVVDGCERLNSFLRASIPQVTLKQIPVPVTTESNRMVISTSYA